ncbi:MAG: PD-(D/E)XK nuclease family protein [Candidatus Omnitrophica bacterium]|nr:PD-(D/E)XK nuclease family protein [Candidatus Omnitrophota bacterium]
MIFQLHTESIASEHLEGMKKAFWKKAAAHLSPNFFADYHPAAVSKFVERMLPYLKDFQGPPAPEWWSRLPATPREFGIRMHQLLSQAFMILRKQSDLIQEALAERNQRRLSEKLFQYLYNELLVDKLVQTTDSRKREIILLAGLGLKEWVKHIAQILSGYPKNKPFNAPLFFIASELAAKAPIVLDGRKKPQRLFLSGQMDAIIFDYRQERFFLYEYKTGAQSNYIAPILQCILYHELIRCCCGENLQVEAVLAYFSPKTAMQAPEAPPPKPAEEQAGVEIAAVSQDCAEKEAKQHLESLVEVLNTIDLTVSPVGTVIGPRFVQLRIFPEAKTTVNQIKSRREDLRVKMRLSLTPGVATGQGYIAVEVERKNPETILLDDPRFKDLPPDYGDRLIFPLGIDMNGAAKWLDLADSNSAHLLIGGTTGSGKSEFIRSMLHSVQGAYSPERVRWIIIDPKQVSYYDYEHSPFLLTPIVRRRDEAIQTLAMLVKEMDDRYRQFSENKIDSIEIWNRRFPQNPMARWLVVFDEYADYMGDKEFRDAIESSIEKLGIMARASGIHLVIALQRPDAKTVSGRIKSNLPGRIAFRTASQIESKIILDEGGAEDLFGKGDMLAKIGPKMLRLQSPIIRS